MPLDRPLAFTVILNKISPSMPRCRARRGYLGHKFSPLGSIFGGRVGIIVLAVAASLLTLPLRELEIIGGISRRMVCRRGGEISISFFSINLVFDAFEIF